MLATAQAAPRALRPARRPWLQLLSGVLGLAGPGAELLRHSEKPWSSATFSGSRHVVALEFRGDAGLAAAEAFMEALPEHDFALSRHKIAEACIGAVEQTMQPQPCITVEAQFLLVEDAC